MSKHTEDDEALDEPATTTPRTGISIISDSTPIRLGLIIALLGLCLAGFGAWIWWAATISAKTDTIIAQLTVLNDKANGHSAAIADLQAWRKLVDTVGTPAMMTKTADLERKMEDLSRQFDLHKAVGSKP